VADAVARTDTPTSTVSRKAPLFYARDTNALLARVARDVVDRRVDPNLVLAKRPVAGSTAQPDAS
jgi:hypothetical protein